MPIGYDRLRPPMGTMALKGVLGLMPPAATWVFTGSILYALCVFVFGLIAGNVISVMYTEHVTRAARRHAANVLTDDLDFAVRLTLPVFLWAPPLCGAIAAAMFIVLAD